MKPLLKYPLLIFGLLIIFNSKVQASPYCSSADFVALYDSSWQCNEKKIWAPHFKKHQSSIKLNADVYRLMGDVSRKVVRELNKK